MANINLVELTGNLTRDPELRMTPSGKQVVSFGIAVGDGFGERARTFYFDCVKWCGSDKQTEFFTSITKGMKVAIAGKLTWRSWTGKDGQKHSKVEVEVRELDLLGTPAKDPMEYASGQQMPIAAAPPQPPATDVYDEEIPF